MKITKQFRFEAAHRLCIDNVDTGKCYNIHGHSYIMNVSLFAPLPNNKSGMLLNYVDLKDIVNKTVVDKLDHSLLNDSFPELVEMSGIPDDGIIPLHITTSEVMSIVITKLLAKEFSKLLDEDNDYNLAMIEKVGVELYETSTSSCYFECAVKDNRPAW